MVDALEAEAPPQPSRPSLADTRCDRLRDNDNLRQRRFRRGTFSSSPLATNDLRKCLNYESLSSFPPVLKIDNCNCNADIRACGVDKFAGECLDHDDTQPFAVGADVMLTNNLWMEAHSLTAPVTPSSTSSNPRTDATRASSWCTSSSTAGLHCHWTTDCRSDHANLLRPASQDLSPPPPPSGLVTFPVTVFKFIQESSKESSFAYVTTIGHSWLVVRLAHAHVVDVREGERTSLK